MRHLPSTKDDSDSSDEDLVFDSKKEVNNKSSSGRPPTSFIFGTEKDKKKPSSPISGSKPPSSPNKTSSNNRRPATNRGIQRRSSNSFLFDSNTSSNNHNISQPKRLSLDEANTSSFTKGTTSAKVAGGSKERELRSSKRVNSSMLKVNPRGGSSIRRGGSMASFTVPKGLTSDQLNSILHDSSENVIGGSSEHAGVRGSFSKKKSCLSSSSLEHGTGEEKSKRRRSSDKMNRSKSVRISTEGNNNNSSSSDDIFANSLSNHNNRRDKLSRSKSARLSTESSGSFNSGKPSEIGKSLNKRDKRNRRPSVDDSNIIFDHEKTSGLSSKDIKQRRKDRARLIKSTGCGDKEKEDSDNDTPSDEDKDQDNTASAAAVESAVNITADTTTTHEESVETEAGEVTSELDSHLAKTKTYKPFQDNTSKTKDSISKGSGSGSKELKRKESNVSSGSSNTTKKKKTVWTSIKQRKWHCFCCITLLFLLIIGTIVGYVIIQAYNERSKVKSSTNLDTIGETNIPSLSPSTSMKPSSQVTNVPSVVPSSIPSRYAINISIAVIVQLDDQPEEIGFTLKSIDNSTTYLERAVGSLSDMKSEVFLESFDIPERTELLFTLEDTSDDGLCPDKQSSNCGYYKVFSGTGDSKTTVISGELAGAYTFTVGKEDALQVAGVDPNEYCKPCPDGKDCGRCAWCNADRAFQSDTIFSYYCYEPHLEVPKKCFIGEKRVQLHNSYVALSANCVSGFKAWPQLKVEETFETSVCVEEVTCIKKFLPFLEEPNCQQELPGAELVKETCQDKVGGSVFGYDWGINAPRENECSTQSKFASSLAQRCCTDGVSYCSTFFENDLSEEEDFITLTLHDGSSPPPTPSPTASSTNNPTLTNSPSFHGYLVTVLIQLDDFPQETGLMIQASTDDDTNVTILERNFGYYTESGELALEKVQIPENTTAFITLTDKEGDGMCCDNGSGNVQVYSDQGSLILDESGIFEFNMSQSFIVGEPETLSPTASSAPTASSPPTANQFDITIEIQLDQWASETGASIQSKDGSETFYNFGSFEDWPAGLIVETIQLPSDIEVNLVVTDTKGDGFCCLYGDGYIKVYAGSVQVDSALLVDKVATFESMLSLPFRVGPPLPSRAPTSSGPTTSNHPTLGDVLVSVVLQLDRYSSETSWSIDSADGLTNYASKPVGYYEEQKSQQVVETVLLPQGYQYTFSIYDFMGDGIPGNGTYALYMGEYNANDNSANLLLNGTGEFGQGRAHKFILGELKTPLLSSSETTPIASTSPPTEPLSSALPSISPSFSPSIFSISDEPSLTPSSQIPTYSPSVNPSTTSPTKMTNIPTNKPTRRPTRGVAVTKKPTFTTSIEVTIKLDGSSSETGWNIALDADASNIIINRPSGYYAGNDTLTITETVILDSAETYRFTVFDTYGDGFCCNEGVGFYSIYHDGQLLVFREGDFEYSYSQTFTIEDENAPGDMIAMTKQVQMLRGADQELESSSYHLKRQRKHHTQAIESET